MNGKNKQVAYISRYSIGLVSPLKCIAMPYPHNILLLDCIIVFPALLYCDNNSDIAQERFNLRIIIVPYKE